jgi:hypothetical protein
VAVLCIRGCTFITYPVGVTTYILAREAESVDYEQHLLVIGIWRMLVSINCSINIIFYFSFSSK